MRDDGPLGVLISGPSCMGKTYLTRTVLALEYEVLTRRVDKIYGYAMRAAGIIEGGTRVQSRKLREGEHSPQTVERFFQAYDEAVVGRLRRAVSVGVTPVFDGYTLMLNDEVSRIAAASREVLGPEARVVRLWLACPYEQYVTNVVARAREKRRKHLLVSELTEEAYERVAREPEPVTGVWQRTIKTADDLRAVADELGLPRHRWYQGFELGPVSIHASPDAHEKVNALASEDVVERDVVDLCCGTSITTILLKHKGAKSAVGVEKKRARVLKAYEVMQTLVDYAGVDAGVQVVRGDARTMLDEMEAVDTVVMFGALHYFEDYVGWLQAMAGRARRAVYVEVLPTTPSDSAAEGMEPADANGVHRFTRDSGTTIITFDPEYLKSLTSRVMPTFAS